MYIEIHNHQDIKQEALYYKLNSILNIENEDGLNKKIPGVYSIFKNDTCLYVGQSKNIASRLATHLRGKYKSCSQIQAWDIELCGFPDFLDRDTSSKKSILDNAEKHLMALLKPIDNIDINMDTKIDDDKCPNIDVNGDFSYLVVNKNEYELIITDSYSRRIEDIATYVDLMNHNKLIDDKLWDMIRSEIAMCDISPYCIGGEK